MMTRRLPNHDAALSALRAKIEAGLGDRRFGWDAVYGPGANGVSVVVDIDSERRERCPVCGESLTGLAYELQCCGSHFAFGHVTRAERPR